MERTDSTSKNDWPMWTMSPVYVPGPLVHWSTGTWYAAGLQVYNQWPKAELIRHLKDAGLVLSEAEVPEPGGSTKRNQQNIGHQGSS